MSLITGVCGKSAPSIGPGAASACAAPPSRAGPAVVARALPLGAGVALAAAPALLLAPGEGVVPVGGGGCGFTHALADAAARTKAAADAADPRRDAALEETTIGGFFEIFPMTPGKEVSISPFFPCRSTSRYRISRSMAS